MPFLPALSPAQNTWSLTGNLGTPRSLHATAVLSDGRVLAAGGCATSSCGPPLGTAEIYSPATKTWVPTGSMASPRNRHTATRLANGKVLVVGGCAVGASCTGLATAELFDPATGKWTFAGSLATGRYDHRAVLLANGEVMIAGGVPVCTSTTCSVTRTVEIYNPTSGWRQGASLSTPRLGHTLTLLSTGGVLLAGGCATTGLPCTALGAEVSSPDVASWAPTGSMANRTRAAATRLLDGRVLYSGGVDSSGFLSKTSQIYDPASNAWTNTGSTGSLRLDHESVRLNSGRVLVFAGANITATEVYDPATGLWSPVGNLQVALQSARSSLLADGTVLAAGGSNSSSTPVASSQLFTAGSTPLSVLSTTNLDLGLAEAGVPSAPQTLTVTNQGLANLAVTDVSLSGGDLRRFFRSTTCTSAPVTPGGTCTVSVVVEPTSYGPLSTTLVITSNAPNSPQSVAVTAFGYEDARGNFQPGAMMSEARTGHTATFLATGKVLVAGGFNFMNGSLTSAELYDPLVNQFVPTQSLNRPRNGHAATLLSSRAVLVTGGGDIRAEIFDPFEPGWVLTRPMTTNRTGHTGTLLIDGLVLVAGGDGLSSAELYDPARNRWTATLSGMSSPRKFHTATLLLNRKVLIAGGISTGSTSLATAEIFDPATGLFSPTGSMAQRRSGHTETRLANGRVLVMGGFDGINALTTAEIYDPSTGTWSAAGETAVPHGGHTTTALESGKLLVAGGYLGCDPEFGICSATSAADLYSPSSSTFRPTGLLLFPRAAHTATLLPNGRVLVTGGVKANTEEPVATTEIYRPN